MMFFFLLPAHSVSKSRKYSNTNYIIFKNSHTVKRGYSADFIYIFKTLTPNKIDYIDLFP